MSETIVKSRRVFPVTVKALCERLGTEASLIGLGEEDAVSFLAMSDLNPIVPGCLFIPYEDTDAVCVEAIQKGAAAVMTDHVIEGIPCILVGDMTRAVLGLCEWIKSFIDLPAVVVAGSEGKTTTKRMVAAVLRTEKKVFSEAGNYNTLQALCRSLQKVDTDAELIVQEVDEKRSHNLENCSRILRPRIALVTNIAEAHIRFFGGLEGLTGSFRGITAGMSADGVVVINADNENSVRAGFDRKVIRVGIHDTTADCVAENIREKPGELEFNVRYGAERDHLRLSVNGEHNVYNALMAYVVGRLEGVAPENIRKGLASYRNSGVRQNICSLGNTMIYADCYNASATSVGYAIRCFDQVASPKRKKVAVLGDIAEIEGYEEETYRKIALALDRSGVDMLVTCGKDSKMLHNFVTRDMIKKHTGDLSELNAYLKTVKKGGGSYLFKASHFMKLEDSIREAFPLVYKKLRWIDSHAR